MSREANGIVREQAHRVLTKSGLSIDMGDGCDLGIGEHFPRGEALELDPVDLVCLVCLVCLVDPVGTAKRRIIGSR